MSSKKIMKDTVITNRRKIITKRYNIIAWAFTLALFFACLIPITILYFTIMGNPANDIGPIIMAVCIIGGFISLLITIGTIISGYKTGYKKKNCFNKEEKYLFMKKYLSYLIIRLVLLFVGLFLVILGLELKEIKGVVTSYCGLHVLMFGLCSTSYIEIKKSMYKEGKLATDDDIIISNSVFPNLDLIERTILSIVLIIVVILIFNLVAGTLIDALKIILLVLSIGVFLYNLYACIRTIAKFNKINIK